MDESQVQEFEAFYERSFAKVYNYARHRTGSGTEADELVSEVFTRALEGWHRYDPAAGERGAWLFGIARNAAADRFRRLRRRLLGGLLELFDTPDPGPRPPEAAARSEDERRLQAALAALDERARDIVCLRYYADMTNRAIAGLIGLTEGNVAVILFRSLKTLRRSLGEEGSHAG
ncbi:MAG: sigma-70 family RNA polymerase sigma factor [Elusimicrobia bacterium]|nr:sigma-70 family RNA polymerase sigma factor [Elusimicrobiota bacterium]